VLEMDKEISKKKLIKGRKEENFLWCWQKVLNKRERGYALCL